MILICWSLFFSASAQYPNHVWAKKTTGTTELPRGIGSDATGSTYSTGVFSGTTDFDPSATVVNVGTQGGSDIYILKLDANGLYVWVRSIGAANNQVPYAIYTEADGDHYVIGEFSSGVVDFDPGAGVSDLDPGLQTEGFIVKLDAAGNFVWAKSIGGDAGSVAPRSITQDPSGNLLITGYFQSTVDFNPDAVTSTTMASLGAEDAFVLKLDNNGVFVWAKAIGNATQDMGVAIAADAADNVYTAGAFSGTVDFDPNGGIFNIPAVAPANDVFISKLDNTGAFVWAKSFGNANTFEVQDMVIDASNDVYFTGKFNGTADFDPNGGTFNLTGAGPAVDNYYLSKITAAGNLAWAITQGNATMSVGNALVRDGSGVIASGYFNGTVDFDLTAATFNLVATGAGPNIFMARYDGSGNMDWAVNEGGIVINDADAHDLIRDAGGNLFVNARFAATLDFDFISGSCTNTLTGNVSNAFIQKVRTTALPTDPVITSFTPTTGGIGTVVTLNGSNFHAGNSDVFVANTQATVTSPTTTRLVATIASGTVSGKIRVSANCLAQTRSSGIMTIAAAGLSIVSTTPAINAAYIPSNSNVSITFNNPIDASTVLNSNLIVRGTQSPLITGTWSGGGTNTLTFDPATNFKLGEQISVTISRSLLSQGGLNLAHGYVFSFSATAGTPQVGPFTFAERLVTFDNGLIPNDIVALDFDGDGDLDIGNANGAAIRDLAYLYVNNGDQTYCSQAFGAHRNVEFHDLDGDGDLDGLSVGANNSGIDWHRNDGATGVDIDNLISASTWSGAVTGGDLDGDGDIDVVAGLLGANIAAYLNNGTGLFTSRPVGSVSPSLGSETAVSMADINSDGHMDVLAFVRNNESVMWFENDGTETFIQHIVAVDSDWPRLTAADLDDDGDMDIIAGNSNSSTGNLAWYENDGAETFTRRVVPGVGPGRLNQVRVVDFDADGDKDMLASARWFENDGSQNFTTHLVSPGMVESVAIHYGDMDNDGDLDILTLSTLQKRIVWHENGTFMSVTGATPANGQRSADANTNITVTFDQPIDATSLNNTTLKVTTRSRGIIAGNYSVSGNTITFDPTVDFRPGEEVAVAVTDRIRSNTGHRPGRTHGFDFRIKVTVAGAPTFTLNPVMTHAATPVGLDVADIDRDGDLDLVTCTASQLLWHRNDGAGNFTSITIPSTGIISGTRITDFNSDGFLDILVGVSGPSEVYMNDGNQNFSSMQILYNPGNTVTPNFFVGDIDRDGLEDAYNNEEWQHRNCDRFESGANVTAPGTAIMLGAGDLDNDGDIDLLRGGGGHQYFLNDGYLGFNTTNFSVSVAVYMDAVDLDGDGDLDVLSGMSSTTLLWYPNDLTTVAADFAPQRTVGTFPSSGQARWIATADLDGDNDLDVIAASPSTDALFWFRNRLNEAGANFTSAAVSNTLDGPAIVKAGDFNGDGKIDLVAISNVDNKLTWFGNNAAVLPPPTVTSFTPTTGPVSTTVTITGTNFSLSPSGNTVRFNSTQAVVTASTATSITTTVPAGATTGTITVTVGANTATSTGTFTVTGPSVKITDVDPLHGWEGLAVVLTGTGFSTTPATNIVDFNGVAAIVTASTSTTITTSVPVGAITGPITVRVNSDGNTTDFDFIVTPPPPTITSFTPGSGLVGIQVIITGTNFGSTPSENVVMFNGTVADVTASSTTSITTTVPIGANTGLITVGVGLNNAMSDDEFEVTGAPLPTITSFNPIEGHVGSVVTITGTNFSATPGSNFVEFNGITAAVTSSTHTSITTIVPAGATTGPITVTVSGNTATSATDFTVTVPVLVVDSQPVAADACAGTNATFSVTASGDIGITYQWQSSTTNAGPFANISDGSGYSDVTTSMLTVSTTGGFGARFYRCEIGSALAATVYSDAAELTVQTVTPPTVQGDHACPQNAISLTATGGSNGQYRWYTQATGGTPIAGQVNSTYTTPVITATTLYYVSLLDGSCESIRTPATATIDVCQPPVITPGTLTTQVGGIVSINLIPLITTANLDLSTLQIVTPPGSGATATISGGVLTIDYSGNEFTGTETIIIEACDVNGRCSQQSLSITVAGAVVVFNAVSPDGQNPIFRLQYIELLPDTKVNTVTIFNRWGDKVFSVSDYNNNDRAFKGFSNSGNKLPSGTYYYSVQFEGGRKSLAGFLELRY
ncbi:MAG TPA: FG-GAP-like repeat-containing protein [Cyclobacteriaceae bacterium]|nr:FG-GAP-like repeat-containing protein [Cyclobacteriaceae bacterium]